MRHEPSIGQLVFVRLFRKWSAARLAGLNPLPHMQVLAAPFAPAPDLILACASLFELTEAHLGRPLEPECCCGSTLSRDEAALIGLLRHAPDAGQAMASTAIPHGLPGAIRWAAFAVLRALAATFGGGAAAVPWPCEDRLVTVCPFGEGRRALANLSTA